MWYRLMLAALLCLPAIGNTIRFQVHYWAASTDGNNEPFALPRFPSALGYNESGRLDWELYTLVQLPYEMPELPPSGPGAELTFAFSATMSFVSNNPVLIQVYRTVNVPGAGIFGDWSYVLGSIGSVPDSVYAIAWYDVFADPGVQYAPPYWEVTGPLTVTYDYTPYEDPLPTPEPGTWGPAAAGLLGVGGLLARRGGYRDARVKPAW